MTRVLIVDDYEDWRRKVRQLLQDRPELQVICEVSDGLEAVQKAGELKPDLIVVDIGLPKLNGIEAARQIRQLHLGSKIIFLSQDNSLDVVQVALSTDAQGYVYKTDVVSDLLPAIEAVLRGKQFVSSSVKGYECTDIPTSKAPPPPRGSVLLSRPRRDSQTEDSGPQLTADRGKARSRLWGGPRKAPGGASKKPHQEVAAESYLLKVLTRWRIGGRKS